MAQHWVVDGEYKLIDFLKRQLGQHISARQIKRSIENNGCLLNGKVERFASHQVHSGDRVDFDFVVKEEIPIDISRVLYSDNHILAFNKPPGISSEDEALQIEPGLSLIHRLDKETSGVLLFAKTEAIRKAMIELFRAKKIHKVYYAWVDGVPAKSNGIIDNYLGKRSAYAGQAIWGAVSASKGLHARTEWRLERQAKNASLLRCVPITGRTHQIRVHLSGMGHPILGDHQYGRTFRCPYRPQRCLLHASEIAFEHPATGKSLAIQAPLPEDMQHVDEVLT